MENSGYFRRVSEFDKKDSIQILVSKDKLKQFVQNPSYQEIANVVISLLREFGSAIFTSPMKISASHLANKFSIPEQSFIDSLNILDNMGIIIFPTSNNQRNCPSHNTKS